MANSPPEPYTGKSSLVLPPNLPLSDFSLLGKLPLQPAKPFLPVPMLTAEKYITGCSHIGNQALKDGHWALARDSFLSCLHHYQERAAYRYNLGLCELATGRYKMAFVHLSTALRLAPGHTEIKQCLKRLSVLERQLRAVNWYSPVATANHTLMLKPFQPHYLPVINGLLQNPATADQVNVSRLKGNAREQAWWQQRLENEQHRTLISMHRDLGLTGICDVRLQGEDGWCWFWHGYHSVTPELGYDTIQLLCRMLQTEGVRRLYTAINKKNTSTQRNLELGGFSHIPVVTDEHESDICFYGHGLDDNKHFTDQKSLIENLFRLLESDSFI